MIDQGCNLKSINQKYRFNRIQLNPYPGILLSVEGFNCGFSIGYHTGIWIPNLYLPISLYGYRSIYGVIRRIGKEPYTPIIHLFVNIG